MVDSDKRQQEAAAWFSRLNQRRVSTDDVHAFAAWRRNPANAAAYAKAERLWDAAGALASDPAIERMTEDAGRRQPGRRRSRPLGYLAAAGVGAAVVICALVGWSVLHTPTYRTEIGERRTINLSDGSSVTLDTASRIAVRISGDRRSIDLIEGQALFDVASDPSRPFTVIAGAVEIRALGTRFHVRRLDGGARVILAEGRVAVTDERTVDGDWTLSPGQQLVTTRPTPAVETVDVPAATSWTTGRLTFEELPLREAVAEMNRYSRVQLVLDASRLGDIPVSGAFNAGDMEGFAAALADLYPVTVSRADGRLIISDRAAGAS
ncbi:FecR domain-containing protein [Brevundimonas sp. BAL450]|uniref:FecR family protein n=1 Tax=Brevundimonas sp. BAL450 TaxID=1708162 RepID=UPI0018C993B7|nr:FecR domain-containing protein [Brevundimonas sp. BAL450]MBG7614684.1 FecR domain-containing protein [Brevundimonas sp. BAL450]